MSKAANVAFLERYGPWALIAGASEGLGAEFAAQLAARGFHLLLVARREAVLAELGEQLEREHGIEVRILPLDLAREDVDSVVLAAISEIEIGLLVYNAAISEIGLYLEIPLSNHMRELAVNCHGPMTLAYLLAQPMSKRHRGGIILMSSLGAMQGSAMIINYAATKAYNRVLAEGLWDELGEHGIDVLASCPGAVSTPGYLASQPRGSMAAMTPRAVVSATLATLGKRPVVIPGWTNRVAAILMERLIPRRATIRLMGRVTRRMYRG